MPDVDNPIVDAVVVDAAATTAVTVVILLKFVTLNGDTEVIGIRVVATAAVAAEIVDCSATFANIEMIV